jgi:hypothetical protein
MEKIGPVLLHECTRPKEGERVALGRVGLLMYVISTWYRCCTAARRWAPRQLPRHWMSDERGQAMRTYFTCRWAVLAGCSGRLLNSKNRKINGLHLHVCVGQTNWQEPYLTPYFRSICMGKKFDRLVHGESFHTKRKSQNFWELRHYFCPKWGS